MTVKSRSAADALSPVYICHGAEGDQCHVLTIAPDPDSPWAATQIACHQFVDGTSSPIGLEPELGEFQDMPLSGAIFKLHCPAIGEDRDMQMWLRNEYTAKPYPINLKLGDFRYAIASSSAPIPRPLIGQELEASVTVESFYTRKLMKGVDVKWVVDGVSTTVPTNDMGVSDFKYVVAKEGKQAITAHLYSPSSGQTEILEFPFTGFDGSPWQLATLRVNADEVEFGKTAALIRAKANEITVEVTEDIAQVLTLAVVDSGGLTITASPGFDAPVQVVDGRVIWQVTSVGDVSGVIKLVISSADIIQPWDILLNVISADLTDELEVRIDGLPASEEGIVFFSGFKKTLTLLPKSGSPVKSIPLKLHCDIEGAMDVTVVSQPDFDVGVDAYSWEVSADGNGTFQLSVLGNDVLTPIVLPSCTVRDIKIRDMVRCRLDHVLLPSWDVYHQITRTTSGYQLDFLATRPEIDGKSLLLETRNAPDRVTVLPKGAQSVGTGSSGTAIWRIGPGPDANLGKFSIQLTVLEIPGLYDEIFLEVISP